MKVFYFNIHSVDKPVFNRIRGPFEKYIFWEVLISESLLSIATILNFVLNQSFTVVTSCWFFYDC